MKKFNNCVESGVFIIPPLALDGDDLLVTNCVDLSRGPFGEPFHHLNSTGSNSHDLMRCRMPEICRLCFLFSPSTLFSSTATPVHNRKKWLAIRSGSGSADESALLAFASFIWPEIRRYTSLRHASVVQIKKKTTQCKRSKVI